MRSTTRLCVDGALGDSRFDHDGWLFQCANLCCSTSNLRCWVSPLRPVNIPAQASVSAKSVIDDREKEQINSLHQKNRGLKKSNKELQSALDQAQEEVNKALEIASSAASRCMKRSRIKEDIKDENEDTSALFESARNRARHVNGPAANINTQAVIDLD